METSESQNSMEMSESQNSAEASESHNSMEASESKNSIEAMDSQLLTETLESKTTVEEIEHSQHSIKTPDSREPAEALESQESTNDIEPAIPSIDEEEEEEKLNQTTSKETSSPPHLESSLSDEEDSEQHLSIADPQNDEQELKTETTTEDMQQDETQQHIENEETNLTNNEYLPTLKEPALEEKDAEIENDFKIIQAPILKLNGNHSLSLNDEDTCSSTTSSASSHNLVIDHPLAEEQPPTSSQENNLPDSEKINQSKSLKRKLSSSDNESHQYKYIHLDNANMSPAKDDDQRQEIPLEAEGQTNSINAENPERSAFFWGKSKEAMIVPKEEPLLVKTNSTNPQYQIKFIEENVPPPMFPQQIHVNNQEPNNGSLKEKPPPPYQSYFGVQSTVAPEPAKFRSPPAYGPYPIYMSNNVQPTAMETEISTLVAKQLSDSCTQVAPIAAVTESKQAIGSYDLYTTPTGKSLPPPKLNFECFKCRSAVFESFSQLRDHHKSCLFAENPKRLLPPSSATPEAPLANGKDKTVALPNPPGPVELSTSLAPTTTTTKKRFYLCSSCGTYHENWNLFLHIREIHNRHVCLYCIRLFPTAEKLSLHLEIKHDLEQNHFNSEEKLRSVSKVDGNSRFLMCCTCQHVFSEHERFSDHVCTEYIQPCTLCGQKGRHLSNCKANPEKRQKTKRKTKTIEAPPPVHQPAAASKTNNKISKMSRKMSAFSSPGLPNDNRLNNNNNNNSSQMVFPTLPLSLQAMPNPLEFSKQNGYSEPPAPAGGLGYAGTKQPPDDFNYHSDDSTNMVIDETCSSNSHFNQMPTVNPFKALDERERQEAIQKTAEVKSTLPPDRVPEAIPEPKPLIVPKIKLCVPKEFQKAVYMEMSSTDSNEDEDQDHEDGSYEGGREELQTSQSPMTEEKNRTERRPEDNNSSSADEKDSNHEDGAELDSKLDRILKAIERTQSEIRKTKERMMRTSPPNVIDHSNESHSAEVPATEQDDAEVLPMEEPIQDEVSPIEPTQAEDSSMEKVQDSIQEPDEPQHESEEPEEIEEPEVPEEPEEPAAPSLECTSEHENSNASNNVVLNETVSWTTPERGMYSPTPPPTPNSAWPSPLYQPEDSPAVIQAVSERENIENMEKECEHAKEHSPETDKMNSSSELDIENIQNQEESTMDIEEKSKQTPPNSSPLQVMDFSPITAEAEKKLDETATSEEPRSQPTQDIDDDEDEEIEVVKEHIPPADGIEVANEDVVITDLLLDRPIEKFEIIEFVRLCVKAVYSLCLYCNHARRIAVCGHSLVLHLLAQHRFSATVDSITAEELLPSTIVSKLKSFLPELEEHYFNLDSYSTLPPKENTTVVGVFNERIFECFQCRFSTRMHKDLYLHNRKMHLKTAILCFMCRANFFSFSEILCHICPGAPNKVTTFDIKFRCCLCDIDKIPSPFRLMVHLRKKHFACDICLEDCHVQAKLSSHVWKHKLHHLCYRCGIAYRNKMDITKHLFWKHGTESIICKRCLQKRWRHVYHFCVPPTSFTCDVCSLCFSKATYLKVHQREHTGDFRYPCTEDNCEEKFVSRKLLLKHSAIHAPPPEVKAEEEEKVEKEEDTREDKKEQQESEVKAEVEEPAPQEEKPAPVEPAEDVKQEEENKSDGKTVEVEKPEIGLKRKKKKSRNKESLEDLNLIAPNLSESDSSGESDVERPPKTDEKNSLVPNVMLSPPSEEDKDEEKSEAVDDKDAEKIMDIWENFKSFQASQQAKKEEDDDVQSFTDSDYPTPILHVASSDHDYCAMYKIRPRIVTEDRSAELPEDSKDPAEDDINSDSESRVHDVMERKESISPTKKKRKSTGSHSSSSGSSSDSSSRSSCSCKTNCSCSSSSSGSGSSSSSEDSDSSTSEGRRRIAKKREERADRSRLKSESSQKISISENVDVGGVDEKEPVVPVIVNEKAEPVFIETDLETAESETDEEFYDEHPQKLASEMLAEKRLQLQEQMRLSPSHNFDIMENSRPSTPSLPEEMVKEKKVKLKKKKRERKSTCKSQAVPPIKLNLSINKVEILSKEPVIHHPTAMQVPEVDLVPPYDLIASPGVAEPPVAQQPMSTPIMQNHTVKPVPFFHTRMSEGSSCSDADSSLKRSQRARRPNKFYGYTSDDENVPGTPLVIGTRTFKPQPPPQLTWRKEDLPAPSKSILLNKQPRTPKTPAGQKGQIKKRVHQKTLSLKKKVHRLPPIPTLKIRPPKLNKPADVAVTLPPPPPPPIPSHHSFSSSRDESDDSDSSDDDLELPAANTVVPAASIIPKWNPAPAAPAVIVEPPPPPPPQASMFNQKIPPALLPNPDFATIQYFKRNNIRYPIAPPAGARQPRDGESVYCYCRCPYDEVSEMIACDGENCLIEWFHFECVGIMVAPQGKWFCAECRPKYSNELYPQLS
ncbi:uncharacterized protein LOC129941238 [Eupeodes corollae]|uniref:uncharacterized protein LOC129941238 n=1 Tax=Eupeodes corollae TaxID=290404 RepID=UPI00249235C3|nr:uncharacterized protein LOC129941238 [Eupeodes corollae]